VCLLPRLSWSWTVLLPSDTYIKPITSITTVLHPFVTYLLTLPHNMVFTADSLKFRRWEYKPVLPKWRYTELRGSPSENKDFSTNIKMII
jgi:hypothetical protein